MKPTLTLLATLLLALLIPPGVASAAAETWRISNEVMEVAISARDAGAVCSLVYDGQEFVNDHDHGRQLQVAWFYNDLDEAYNPTEAGAAKDGVGPRSTGQPAQTGHARNRHAIIEK